MSIWLKLIARELIHCTKLSLKRNSGAWVFNDMNYYWYQNFCFSFKCLAFEQILNCLIFYPLIFCGYSKHTRNNITYKGKSLSKLCFADNNLHLPLEIDWLNYSKRGKSAKNLQLHILEKSYLENWFFFSNIHVHSK